jgi:hypothetical protein
VSEIETVAAPEPAVEAPPEYEAPSLQIVPVEFIIDSHRINAEIQHPGAPRRLVDYLNSVDGPRINLHNCRVGQAADPESAGRYPIAQLFRNAILIAIPRGNTTFTARSLDLVPKRPVPATLVVPGYDVSGNIYMVPQIDPNDTPLIGNHHFVPMTETTVTPADPRYPAWQEPLLIVNMSRTLLYAPK